MKTFRRITLAVIAILMVVLAAGWLFINHLQHRAVPDYAASVDLENLVDEVTVIRDSLAIPHIYAKNAEDLYRVVGYVTAQDRLWQMDLMRRITTGQLSEIFGEDMLGTDQLFRAFDFSGKSARVLDTTDPGIIKCLEAYSDGVNQFIQQHQKKLSFEFALLGYKPEPWTPVHTTNLIGYMAWDLTSGWSSDMAMYKIAQVVDDTLLQELFPWEDDFKTRYVFPEYMEEHPELVMNTTIEQAQKVIDKLGIQVFEASNNWAVSGERSETGMPLLANDMHLGFMSPGIWYQMHQVIEGELDVTGVVLPGQPYVICGHNQDIAWGMTNLTVDNLDFYLETINPQDSNQYKLNGKWEELRIVEEKISVKGQKEPVTRINKFTHRGPVVSTFKDVKDKTISARWIGTDYSNELRSVHLFNRASNWEEFRDAATTFIAVSQNIVYADKQGNIGLQAAGGVPIREGDHVMVYPGDTTKYDWGEHDRVPFENLPYTYNPESGMVSSANNRTVSEDYPYYIGTWFALPNRIDRIREMLEEKELHSVASFREMHSDQLSAFARRLTPVYLDVLTGNVEGVAEAALAELRNWEYHMDPALSAPLIYEQVFAEVIRVVYEDELGDVFPQLMDNNIIARFHIYELAISLESAWCDDIGTTDRVETFSDNIKKAYGAAIDTLVAWAGEDVMQWRYGDIHTLTIEHPMGGVGIVQKLFDPNLGPYTVGGSFHTVAPYSYPVGTNYNVTHGASQRHVYDLADWDRSKTVIPTGTSGVPASPYYGNQAEMYIDFKYHDDHFSREAVEANMKYKAVFR
ncbi:MAG: penicillin acylase family protein [Bacteroidales bacterium]|nr:penicillin acylase family protein [Bacteroidales bacterium]MDT8431019.1 penicillin acylase family protein [Bacteroidales bacterium]